jgi:hypothetical protein
MGFPGEQMVRIRIDVSDLHFYVECTEKPGGHINPEETWNMLIGEIVEPILAEIRDAEHRARKQLMGVGKGPW